MPLRLEVYSEFADKWHQAHIYWWETLESAKNDYIRCGYRVRIIDKPIIRYDTKAKAKTTRKK